MVKCWIMQGTSAAGVTFVPREPFSLSSLLCNREVSSKLAFNCLGDMAAGLTPHIKVSALQWAGFVIY